MLMPPAKPTVYIIIPAYNVEQCIKRSVMSVLDQKEIDIKIIIVNHGSSDGTGDVIATNFRQENRVIYISLKRIPKERPSASRPLNAGYAYIKKNYLLDDFCWIMRLDADDFLVDQYIISHSLQLGKYNKIICGILTFFDEKTYGSTLYGTKIKLRTKQGMLKKGAYAAAHPAIFVRGDFLNSLPLFPVVYDENITYGEDLDVTLRLFRHAFDFDCEFLEKSVLFKSLNEFSLTSITSKKNQWKDIYYVFKKNKSISKLLLVYFFCDLLLRNKKQRFYFLRKIFGLPANKVGDIISISSKFVLKRLQEIE